MVGEDGVGLGTWVEMGRHFRCIVSSTPDTLQHGFDDTALDHAPCVGLTHPLRITVLLHYHCHWSGRYIHCEAK